MRNFVFFEFKYIYFFVCITDLYKYVTILNKIACFSLNGPYKSCLSKEYKEIKFQIKMSLKLNVKIILSIKISVKWWSLFSKNSIYWKSLIFKIIRVEPQTLLLIFVRYLDCEIKCFRIEIKFLIKIHKRFLYEMDKSRRNILRCTNLEFIKNFKTYLSKYFLTFKN